MAARLHHPRSRHDLATRLWHWINALTILIMVMSGLTIFNAHPRLYWGDVGTWGDIAWLQIGSSQERGLLFIGDRMFDTTGWLGHWTDAQGEVQNWAFPGWITIPSDYDLAQGRIWHLLFAWVFVLGWLSYLGRGLISGHLWRDVLPRLGDLAPRALWLEIRHHLRISAIRAMADKGYNSIQRLSYLAVILGLIPLMILTGLSMSPGMNAVLPWLPELFGGRQSARSIHFLGLCAILIFVAVHLVMVLLAGPIRLTWGMITGGPVRSEGAGHGG